MSPTSRLEGRTRSRYNDWDDKPKDSNDMPDYFDNFRGPHSE